MTFTTGRAPGALPLVGHGLRLLRRPVGFLASLPAHGDLVEVRLGPRPAYVPCHPRLLNQVLTDDRTFDKGGPLMEKAREVAGNDLLTCPHRDHRPLRRLVQPAFKKTDLGQYGEVMEQEITALVESWSPDRVVDTFAELSRVGVRIIARALFGADLDLATADGLHRAFKAFSAQVGVRMFVPDLLQALPVPVNRRYRQSIHDLHTIVDQIIADSQGGLLSVLAGADKDHAEIRDEVIGLLGAGTETTAVGVTWALHLLTRHPQVQDRLRREVDTVLNGRSPRFADLPTLPYTANVITEALRLHPPIWLSTRATTAPVEVAGTRLPIGATILYSPAVVHRRADVFDRPDTFEPDRWSPGRGLTVPRGAFVPFGGGARKCLGDEFAMAEATLTLAGIVGRLRIEPSTGSDLRPAPLAGINHPRKLMLRTRHRDPS
ncbi:pentalenene oxygenase [Actinokineospora alba]|uniref:Pentalenene oxygenase n=1 Tax=Actinokineospora alba TaxID=504798 RepID=A0A1H0FAV6_9PSEU|nr:cytochrome P450 [Actinokineospora alba]TDP69406.1 pentalenene oxygenase [Actinokineospora alba]SDI17395.1 pentalenene oxygenase [Actinokineospora alba]SDN91696.1 pentalenene oxygenase [Actinokineospora alba]